MQCDDARAGPGDTLAEQRRFRALRRTVVRLRRVSLLILRAAGAAGMLIGVLVLVGWALFLPQLKSVLPHAVAMKPNTALAVALAGGALLLRAPEPKGGATARALATALGAAVAAIGLATASEFAFGWNLHIDAALMPGPSAPASASGRMSPYSTAGLACLGLGLMLAPGRRGYKHAVALGIGTLMIGLVWLVGYAWGAPELLTDRWLSPLALHTALAFVLLGTGVVIAAIRCRPLPRSYRMWVDPVELKLAGSLVAVVVALIFVGGLTYDAAAESAQAAQRLAELRRFREQLARFEDDTAEAAIAQRMYLLTGDTSQVQRWERWVEELPQHREALRRSAEPLGPIEQTQLRALERAAGELRDALALSVQAHREHGRDPALALLRQGRSTAALALLRTVAESAEAREHMQADSYEQLLLRGRQRTLVITFVSWLAAAAMLGATLFAIRREMAARSRAERQLRRSSSAMAGAHRFLQSVIQNIPHMIFIKEAKQLRFELLNPAGEEIFGVRQSDVLGKNDEDFFPPGQAALFVARDRETLALGEVLDIPEEEIQSPTLGTRVLHTKKIPLRNDRGQPTHLLGISEDVTLAREQDRRIRALNEELATRAAEVERLIQANSDFLATMSHEIRTPMNGMLGTLELLALTAMSEQQRGMLAVVRGSGESLLRIINDILDFSKIEAQRLELREEVASVEALVRDICNIHAPAASSKAVVVRATIDPALCPALHVDAVRLRQVLNNFASNAVKFTRKGEVEIRAEVVGQAADLQSVRFSVRDTGAGISPADQQRLFHPFVQVGDARGGASGGTGLGLVIALRLVELMGGSVNLQSEPGAGTIVSFTLELRTARAELLPKDMAQQTVELRAAFARTRPVPRQEDAAAEGTLVLVVDDHPVNRMLLRDQLATLGYACECAQDGREALEQWRRGCFGLVLTDCQMPVMDGYELARRIRAEEAQDARPPTPIVACTAALNELDRARAAGMNDALVKPVQLTDIRSKLDHWLPLPAASQPDAVIDLDLIASNWGSDPQTIASIRQAFVASVKDDTSALREAAARGDLDEVRGFAHRMLGAARMVGAHVLAAVCDRLQIAARDGDVLEVAQLMASLQKEYGRIVQELG
jgi:PAS domain S-box-containing protein